LGGGGAGAAGIMQSGVPGGYNVLSLGAQGHKLLYLNGTSQRIGVGTDAPLATFDIHGTFGLMDGNQGAGKVLTSDANGLASWSYNGHYVGESYGGGIVFYVYDNGKHGLIAATTDQDVGMRWFNNNYRHTGSTGDGVNAGLMNTTLIIALQIPDNYAGNFAAKVCSDYSVTVGGVNYGDWYLPSKYELNLLYQQKDVVGGFSLYEYWSSTEQDASNAWFQFFDSGVQDYYFKISTYSVRAVRAF
jgi:hypothetical protein